MVTLKLWIKMSLIPLHFLKNIQSVLVLLASTFPVCHMHIICRLKSRHIKLPLKIIFQWNKFRTFFFYCWPLRYFEVVTSGSWKALVLGCSTFQYEVVINAPSLSVFFSFWWLSWRCTILWILLSFASSACFNLFNS